MSETLPPPPSSAFGAFAHGYRSGLATTMTFVLFGNMTAFGALAHDLDFSLLWAVLATILVYAGPAQVILVAALGSGGTLVEAGLAVTLSAVRLMPMVASLIPSIRNPKSSVGALMVPSHFIAVSFYSEAVRELPKVAREDRMMFSNGLGLGMMTLSLVGTVLGYYAARGLPALFAAAILFLTPVSFLISTGRGAVTLSDRLALWLGFSAAALMALAGWTTAILPAAFLGGTLGYGIDRFRRSRA